MNKVIRNRIIKMAVLGAILVSSASTFSANYIIGYQSRAYAEINCISEFYRFWLVSRGGTPERGEIWSVSPQVPVAEGETRPNPTKYVMGLPGDTVRVTDDNVYINDVALNYPQHSITQNPDYEPGSIEGVYHLGEGEYFFLGDTEYSFDSRFWGPVAEADLIGQAKGLLR